MIQLSPVSKEMGAVAGAFVGGWRVGLLNYEKKDVAIIEL